LGNINLYLHLHFYFPHVWLSVEHQSQTLNTLKHPLIFLAIPSLVLVKISMLFEYPKEGITLNTTYLAPHETYELHELLTFKNLCLTKSTTMSQLVQDSELKSILSQDVTKTTEQVQRIQQFITNRGEQQ
jgi:similar to spore coat protein